MRAKDLPVISVIITCYNYGSYVGQAIKSVLDQTYENIELIVINDGSVDDSDAVIRRYVKPNPHIRYVHQKNLGANISRNKGIGMSTGEFVFLLDADNWLDNEHLASLHKTISKTNADVIYSNVKDFGDDDILHIVPEYNIEILKTTNYIDTSTLIRKSSLNGKYFDIELNRKFLQDWDFYLGLALSGLKIVKSPDTKLNYRVHGKQNGNNASSIEKIEKYLTVYNYIVDKYRGQFPSQFNSSVEWFIGLHVRTHYLQRTILEKEKMIDELIRSAAKKDSDLFQILNSKSYRIGRIITKPYRIIRKLF